MRKWIAALTVGALVVGGSAIASAQTADPATDPATDRPGIVSQVLDELVTDGVITEDQAAAIVTALDEARQERRAERQARREQLRSFWEDGVLTADEIAQLPEPNPFSDPDGPFAAYLDDGQLTTDEVRQVREARKETIEEQRQQMQEFLADGVITADELAQLPEDHPLRDPEGPAAEYLADGQLTADELAQLRPHRPGFRPGHRGGPGFPGFGG